MKKHVIQILLCGTWLSHLSPCLRPHSFFISEISQGPPLWGGRFEIYSPIFLLGCLVNELFLSSKLPCLSIWFAVCWANEPSSVTIAWHPKEIYWSLFLTRWLSEGSSSYWLVDLQKHFHWGILPLIHWKGLNCFWWLIVTFCLPLPDNLLAISPRPKSISHKFWIPPISLVRFVICNLLQSFHHLSQIDIHPCIKP